MNCLKTTVIFILCFFLLTCGIDEFYYLPQVPENNIRSELNSKATLNIPPISQSYATGYAIYYRIYVSNLEISITDINTSSPNQNIINTNIYKDYKYLFSYTDPTNTTIITSLNTFRNRGYYELEGDDIDKVLSTSGGSFSINFDPIPGVEPYIDYNGNRDLLIRSNDKGAFNTKPDDNRYFFSTDELKDIENATSLINADVSGQKDENDNAYVSMYIVAVGQNRNFTKLYGKPTHINIFKLPPLF